MTPRDVLVTVAAGTLVVLALADLYADALVAAIAFAVAWWLLREVGVDERPDEPVSRPPVARG